MLRFDSFEETKYLRARPELPQHQRTLDIPSDHTCIHESHNSHDTIKQWIFSSWWEPQRWLPCFARACGHIFPADLSPLFLFPIPLFRPSFPRVCCFWWLPLQVVGVVILLGPRVQGLVSALLQVEAGKRSRFPPGLEPQRGARGDGLGAAREGAGRPSAKQVLNVLVHLRDVLAYSSILRKTEDED